MRGEETDRLRAKKKQIYEELKDAVDNLPLWLEVDLDQLGVRKPKPKNHFSSSKPAVHGPTPWKPEYAGQEPPF
jgi:hypothetical protein